MDWWAWVLVAFAWPFAVYVTATFWGAGVVAGETKYLALLGRQQRKGGDERGI